MSDIIIIFAVLLGVILASIVANQLKKVPKAFITIAIGFALSFVPYIREHVALESEFFMMFIIAPILYYDAQRFNPYRVSKHLRSIIYLAGSLVILTALVTTLIGVPVGLAHSIPLSLLIASIVTPTDAVAANSITENFAVPEGTKTALEYESLFNDATGLVLMSIALTGVEANRLSLTAGVWKLIKVAGGGVLVGMMLGYLIYLLIDFIASQTSDSMSSVVPMMIMTPFIAYFIAESIGVSGVLAVVVAAIFQVQRTMRTRLSLVHDGLTSRSLWQVLSSVLNNAVFVLLGMNIFNVIDLIKNMTKSELLHSSALAVLSYFAMLIARGLLAYYRHEETWSELIGPDGSSERRHNAVTFALSGVHGAVTLALAFSIPTNVPFRPGLILAAAIVIGLSLIVPTLVLPFWLPAKQAPVTVDDLQEARLEMFAATKTELKQKQLPEELYLGIVEYLSSQVRPNRFSKNQRLFNRLLQDTAKASRTYVQTITAVDPAIRHAYLHLIDLMLAEELSFAPWRSLKATLSRRELNWGFQRYQQRGIHAGMTNQEREEKRSANIAELQQQWCSISNENSTYMMAWVTERRNEVGDVGAHDAWERILDIYRFRHASLLRGLNRVELKKEHIMKALNSEMQYVLRRLYDGGFSQEIGDRLIQEIAEAQAWQSQQTMLDPKRAGRRVF